MRNWKLDKKIPAGKFSLTGWDLNCLAVIYIFHWASQLASGAMEAAASFLSPVFSFLGIPPETAALVLVRPISGSAALAVGADLMAQYGPDSPIGRTAAIMLGSTETTFYTISVYFGAAGVRRTRYAVPAALLADLTGFCMASLTARLFF